MTGGARPIFGIFEGGGAKGIAHIGAIAAASKHNLEFIGVAGASAGAIIAALVAAGYSADALMNPDDRDQNILRLRGLNPIDLLGADEWKKFVRLRAGITRAASAIALGGLLPAFVIAPRATRGMLRIRSRQGFFKTDKIRDFINEALRDSLRELYADAGFNPDSVPKRIKFRDLDYSKFDDLSPLKIVATDTKLCELAIFSQEQTPDVEIGEAVAASVAIPFVFEPVSITSYKDGTTGPYADGGLISNLPTWVFTEEKLAYARTYSNEPPVPIIAFSLVDHPDTAEHDGWWRTFSPKFVGYVERVARASIFGSQQISQRFIEDVVLVPLTSKLGVMDFDAGWPAVRQAYIDGKLAASHQLKSALHTKPDRIRSELARIATDIQVKMNELRAVADLPAITHLRANFIERFGNGSFRVNHSYNMDKDADDRLVLDPECPGAPSAFGERTLTFEKFTPDVIAKRDARMTKYERALLRPSLYSIISTPVFKDRLNWKKDASERETPLGVFCLDSDQDLEVDFKSPQIQSLLAAESYEISAALTKE